MTSTDAVITKKKVSSTKIEEPKKYKVIVCNDDVTPIEFVIVMLVTIFRHDEDTAISLTNKVHTQGSAVVGIYRYEIAEQKALDGISLARQNGWPLIIKIEQE